MYLLVFKFYKYFKSYPKDKKSFTGCFENHSNKFKAFYHIQIIFKKFTT